MSLRRVWVLGWPIEHSKSPLIHNHWIKELGIENATYEKRAIMPADLSDCLDAFRDLGIVGANVTVPHKEAAFAHLTHHDATAKQLKAVNTIVDCGTHFEGRNTDGYGFMANLTAGAPDFDMRQGPAMVLGAGGAARAILAALANAGVPEIRLANRTREKAEALCQDLEIEATLINWDEVADALDGVNLLINTTSLGMKNMEPLELSLDRLPTSALVTDIVYAPLETRLLAQARKRGNQTVDGLGMLLHQAVPGFEAWFGVRPTVTQELRDLILNETV